MNKKPIRDKLWSHVGGHKNDLNSGTTNQWEMGILYAINDVVVQVELGRNQLRDNSK